MQLEAFNEKKSEGATDADIRRLPLASITYVFPIRYVPIVELVG
jgi:hypothetical protein